MTEYLLDTHALIWWWFADPSLSDNARALIEEERGRIFVSAVSVYEIANKFRGGKAPKLGELLTDIDAAIAADGFVPLALSSHHARRAGLLASDHRDPFDRMIAAQGILERKTVVTRDREIATFGCEVLW